MSETTGAKKSELQASVSFRFKEDKLFLEELAKQEGRTLGRQLQSLLEKYVYIHYPELMKLRKPPGVPVSFGPGAQHVPTFMEQQQAAEMAAKYAAEQMGGLGQAYPNPNVIPEEPNIHHTQEYGGIPIG